MERAEAEAIYDAGRGAVVEVLLAMDRRIAQLEARVEQLERQLGRNSRNSSLPPSEDRSGAAPRRRGKDRSGRLPGGQSGHEGHGRELLPASAVDELVDHWPASCGCGHVFAEGDRVAVREPARHQVEELPQIAVRVTEHRCQRVRCPDCGLERTGELPGEVAGSAFGPRLQAAVATLSVRNRVSRRDLVELCEELFGARISTGTIDAILARVGDALEQPYEQLLGQMQRSRALNVDETGWRLKGVQRTLWGAFTEKIAVFKVTANRHEQHLRELLADHTGIVTSDRWWAYDHLPLRRRQICWSHLQRDFQAQAEGSGAEQEFGQAGLRICERVFWAWEVYQHTHDRPGLQLEIRGLRRQLKPILRQYRGKAPRYKRSRGFARNLLKAWPALWTFADRPGVTPTNNHAERALRGAVIYRKLSLGSQSHAGERRIERLLSASITCRLQHRSMFGYLAELLAANARGDPVSTLA
ncbi:MAG TPA: IS66 family transposase [Solirubrobacteraceae bacterium]